MVYDLVIQLVSCWTAITKLCGRWKTYAGRICTKFYVHLLNKRQQCSYFFSSSCFHWLASLLWGGLCLSLVSVLAGTGKSHNFTSQTQPPQCRSLSVSHGEGRVWWCLVGFCVHIECINQVTWKACCTLPALEKAIFGTCLPFEMSDVQSIIDSGSLPWCRKMAIAANMCNWGSI